MTATLVRTTQLTAPPFRPIARVAMPAPARPIIVMDVDGVLANFALGAWQAHGRTGGPTFPLGNYFALPGMLGVSEADFWATIDNYAFWANLPEYPEAQSFITQVGNLGQIVYSTMIPGMHTDALRGKADWLYDRFGVWPRDIAFGSRKWLLAQPGRLLIDDYDMNVSEWRTHGGTAILFPRDYNSRHAYAGAGVYERVLDEVKAAIRKGAE